MGLTSISIKKSKELRYAREISITATKVRITNTKTASIPDYVLKSGQSMANAGKSDTKSSKKKGGEEEANNSAGVAASGGGGNADSSQKNESKKGHSILYGIAGGLFKKKK